jgi:hypothetical protein
VQEEKQRKHLEFTLKKLQDAVAQLSKDYEQEFGRKDSLVVVIRSISSMISDLQISSSWKVSPCKISSTMKKRTILKKKK